MAFDTPPPGPWIYLGVDPSDGIGEYAPQSRIPEIITKIVTTPAPITAKETAVRNFLAAQGHDRLAASSDEYMRHVMLNLSICIPGEYEDAAEDIIAEMRSMYGGA
jgi:hypothetical protein